MINSDLVRLTWHLELSITTLLRADLNLIIQLWDTRSRKLLSTLNCRTVEESEFLYCGQFYTQDKVICGGSGVTNAKLVDTLENKVQ